MHKKLYLIYLLSLMLFSFNHTIFANSYYIDGSHTEVSFKVPHMGVSKTRGLFGDVQGTLNWSGKENIKKASFEGIIDVFSINTLNKKRDDHLRSSDFFNMKKYSKIRFNSTKIYEENNEIWVEGKLTIKGKTKTVNFPIVVSGPVTDFRGNKRIGIEGFLSIDRRDYDITWNKTLDKGGLVVGNKVEISLNVEGIEK